VATPMRQTIGGCLIRSYSAAQELAVACATSWAGLVVLAVGFGELPGTVAETVRVDPPHPARRSTAQVTSAMVVFTQATMSRILTIRAQVGYSEQWGRV
jgi:hypothetical protein